MQRLLLIFCLMAARPLFAQTATATGSWYGRADVELSGMHNNYLTELVLKQNGNRVDGVFGYYFRDKYQSFFVHGRYNPKTHEVIIQNIPVIYFNSNSTVNSIDCNTNFVGVIIRSKVQSTLKGAFYHDDKYKYMCPDLKVSYTLDRDEQQQQNNMQEAVANSGKVWKPTAEDYIVDAVKTDQLAKTDTVTKTPPPTTVISRTETTVRPADTTAVAKTETPVKTIDTTQSTPALVTAPIADPAKEDTKVIAESFVKRKEVVTQVLDVESDSVRLSFYDNGEIDGDSISIFVNNQVVLTHQGLAARALTMYLHLDSTLDVNEISMFAENLGKYPPNTALMVVTDGKNRYEVFMSSSLTENATIQIKRKKSP